VRQDGTFDRQTTKSTIYPTNNHTKHNNINKNNNIPITNTTNTNNKTIKRQTKYRRGLSICVRHYYYFVFSQSYIRRLSCLTMSEVIKLMRKIFLLIAIINLITSDIVTNNSVYEYFPQILCGEYFLTNAIIY
jgi:hypothetical protein